MRIRLIDITAMLRWLSRLLFGLALVANIMSFIILFRPFYRLEVQPSELYWFNALGIALSNHSPLTRLNTVDWDTVSEGVTQGAVLLPIAILWLLVTFNFLTTRRALLTSLVLFSPLIVYSHLIFIPFLLFNGGFATIATWVTIFLTFVTLIFLFKKRTLLILLVLFLPVILSFCLTLCLAPFAKDIYSTFINSLFLSTVAVWLLITFNLSFKKRTLLVSRFLILPLIICEWPLLELADKNDVQAKCLLLLVAVAITLLLSLKRLLGKAVKIIELGACVFLSFLATLTAFVTGGSEIHVGGMTYYLSFEYGFQLLWQTMLVTWLSILLAGLSDRFSRRKYKELLPEQ